MTDAVACGTHFGTSVRTLRAGGVVVSEATYAPHQRVPLHFHDAPQICLVLEGGYDESCGTTRLSCEPPAVLLHGAGQLHAEVFSARGARCLNIRIPLEMTTSGAATSVSVPDVRLSRRGLPSGLALRLAAELRARDGLAELVIPGLALALFADLLRQPGLLTSGTPPRWLERIRERLHEEFAAPPLHGDLARQEQMHPVSLARAFVHHYGCTVGKYVRQRRLEFAVRALTQSESSLAAVAHGAGFADQSHFTRVFRRFAGMTPGAFKRQFGRSSAVHSC